MEGLEDIALSAASEQFHYSHFDSDIHYSFIENSSDEESGLSIEQHTSGSSSSSASALSCTCSTNVYLGPSSSNDTVKQKINHTTTSINKLEYGDTRCHILSCTDKNEAETGSLDNEKNGRIINTMDGGSCHVNNCNLLSKSDQYKKFFEVNYHTAFRETQSDEKCRNDFEQCKETNCAYKVRQDDIFSQHDVTESYATKKDNKIINTNVDWVNASFEDYNFYDKQNSQLTCICSTNDDTESEHTATTNTNSERSFCLQCSQDREYKHTSSRVSSDDSASEITSRNDVKQSLGDQTNDRSNLVAAYYCYSANDEFRGKICEKNPEKVCISWLEDELSKCSKNSKSNNSLNLLERNFTSVERKHTKSDENAFHEMIDISLKNDNETTFEYTNYPIQEISGNQRENNNAQLPFDNAIKNHVLCRRNQKSKSSILDFPVFVTGCASLETEFNNVYKNRSLYELNDGLSIMEYTNHINLIKQSSIEKCHLWLSGKTYQGAYDTKNTLFRIKSRSAPSLRNVSTIIQHEYCQSKSNTTVPESISDFLSKTRILKASSSANFSLKQPQNTSYTLEKNEKTIWKLPLSSLTEISCYPCVTNLMNTTLKGLRRRGISLLCLLLIGLLAVLFLSFSVCLLIALHSKQVDCFPLKSMYTLETETELSKKWIGPWRTSVNAAKKLVRRPPDTTNCNTWKKQYYIKQGLSLYISNILFWLWQRITWSVFQEPDESSITEDPAYLVNCFYYFGHTISDMYSRTIGVQRTVTPELSLQNVNLLSIYDLATFSTRLCYICLLFLCTATILAFYEYFQDKRWRRKQKEKPFLRSLSRPNSAEGSQSCSVAILKLSARTLTYKTVFNSYPSTASNSSRRGNLTV
ncbi:uncharacterized protein LOC143252360 [Tachypleus tridentatus]|uniref:uncharacterized protein LOC143252360 n=1 Tax=Tachypleus tridentatus TaxID=6853 RepID=UPI003FD34669